MSTTLTMLNKLRTLALCLPLGSSSGTTTRLLKITEASTTDDLSPRRHMSLPSSTATGGGVAGGGATKPAGGCVVKPAKVSPLEDILNKIMSSLETRRRACSRPNNLEVSSALNVVCTCIVEPLTKNTFRTSRFVLCGEFVLFQR